MQKGTVEICCNSLQSAINAQAAGADRVELCSGLQEGGITPSLGLIEEVIAQLAIPVYVLIRPRGGDFCYTDDEIKIMLRDISWCKELGAKGIVTGALTPNCELDSERVPVLIEAIGDLDWTFHRAFDVIQNPFEELAQLKSYGCRRILTSGGKQNAMEGKDMIAQLVKEYPNEVSVMPGGGVSEENISGLISATGVREIHFSASVATNAYDNFPVNQFATFTSLERATEMVSLAREAFNR